MPHETPDKTPDECDATVPRIRSRRVRTAGRASTPGCDRRSWLATGLTTLGGLVLAGCGGGTSNGPPPARVDRPRRPGGASPVDPRPIPPTAEPTIRVRIDGLAAGESFSITPAGRWIRVVDEGDGAGAVFDGGLRIESLVDGWRLQPVRGPVLRVPRGRLECRSVPGEPNRLHLEREDRTTVWMPGGLAVVPTASPRNDRTRADLVLLARMEDYLPGVLARELFGHWSPACFRAQAIAARSFAVCEAAHWKDRRHFDLTIGPETQAWEGLATASRSHGDRSGPESDAVASTRGMLLVWDGLVVPTYFSSCCGGVPATAHDAIGSNPANGIPPLQGRGDREACCEEAPTWRWVRNAATPGIARGLAAWALRQGRQGAIDLASLRNIEVLEVNRHGRPVAFELRDRSGRRDTWASETFRRGLGAALPKGSKPIYSAAIEPHVEPASARFLGRGHGHGVGLCQYGAQAMATRGHAADAILARYYPEARIHSAWV